MTEYFFPGSKPPWSSLSFWGMFDITNLGRCNEAYFSENMWSDRGQNSLEASPCKKEKKKKLLQFTSHLVVVLSAGIRFIYIHILLIKAVWFMCAVWDVLVLCIIKFLLTAVAASTSPDRSLLWKVQTTSWKFLPQQPNTAAFFTPSFFSSCADLES